MNCQDCGSTEAFVHLTEIVDGEVRSVWLCSRCSRHRHNGQRPAFASEAAGSSDSDDLASFLGEEFLHPAPAEHPNLPTFCPSCDYTLEDWRSTNLLGCPRCYQAFRDTLGPHMSRFHGHASHFGKIPENRAEDPNQLATIQKVRVALEKAISAEDFEEAANLRDMLHLLKSGKMEEK